MSIPKAIKTASPFDGNTEAFLLDDGRIVFSGRGAVRALTGLSCREGAGFENYTRDIVKENSCSELPLVTFETLAGRRAIGPTLDVFIEVVDWWHDRFIAQRSASAAAAPKRQREQDRIARVRA